MSSYPKSNPGCYHSLINYLSSITGLSPRKIIIVKSFDRLYINPKAKKKKLAYKSHDITAISSEGVRMAYIQDGNKRFDQKYPEFKLDHFEVSVYRSSKEFGVDLQPSGSYRDSLGGGWHTNTPLYEHNGNFFAPGMECAH